MSSSRVTAAFSPESIAAVLVAVIAVVVISTQVVAGPAIIAGSSPSPAPSSSALAAGPTIPPLIRSSLATALIVNERLAAHAETLRTAVEARKPVAEDIAALLRAVNTEMTVGNEAGNRLLVEPATATLGRALLDFYGAVAERNAETLGTSIRNAPAYVAGGRATVTLLEGLPKLNDQIQAALDSEPSAPPPTPTPPPSPSPSPSAAPSGEPTPTATVTPRASVSPSAAPGGGLVPNGDFEQGLAGWSLGVLAPAAATVAIEAGSGVSGSDAARIDITAGGEARSGISLARKGIPLVQGTTYTVQVAVRAASSREVRVRLTGQGGLTYAARVYTVGTTWSVVTFDVGQLVTDPNAELAVDVGRGGAAVWVDDVSLQERTAG